MKRTQDIVIGDYTIQNELITPEKRQRMVKMMLDIHEQKEYRPLAAFIAVSIADRYLRVLDEAEYPNLSVLAVISVLLSAKLEQHIKPNFKRMVNMLESGKNKMITKSNLISLENQILSKLQFDLQWAGPLPFMERYLRLLKVHNFERI